MRTKLRGAHLLACFAALAVAGCSLQGAAEKVLLGRDFILTPGLPYGENARQPLDVYRPREAAPGAPVVVFFYGGRWQSGAKEQYRLLGDALTREGFVAVIPDYRLYPEAISGMGGGRGTRHPLGAGQHRRFGGDPESWWRVTRPAGTSRSCSRSTRGGSGRPARRPRSARVRGARRAGGHHVDRSRRADPHGARAGWPATYQ